MHNRNVVAATLALLAMVGFLAAFVVLSFLPVPLANKDFFNMGFIALIGFVGTAFGYYLGSSQGSARKSELLAQPPLQMAPIPSAAAEAGFIRLPLLALLGLVAGLFLFAGCATVKNDSPQITAGKSLLAVKGTIVTAASTTDALCNTKQLKPDICMQAKVAYEMAKPAYDSAVDAYLLMSTGGDSAAFGAALIRVQDIAKHMLLLAGGAQ